MLKIKYNILIFFLILLFSIIRLGIQDNEYENLTSNFEYKEIKYDNLIKNCDLLNEINVNLIDKIEEKNFLYFLINKRNLLTNYLLRKDIGEFHNVIFKKQIGTRMWNSVYVDKNTKYVFFNFIDFSSKDVNDLYANISIENYIENIPKKYLHNFKNFYAIDLSYLEKKNNFFIHINTPYTNIIPEMLSINTDFNLKKYTDCFINDDFDIINPFHNKLYKYKKNGISIKSSSFYSLHFIELKDRLIVEKNNPRKYLWMSKHLYFEYFISFVNKELRFFIFILLFQIFIIKNKDNKFNKKNIFLFILFLSMYVFSNELNLIVLNDILFIISLIYFKKIMPIFLRHIS